MQIVLRKSKIIKLTAHVVFLILLIVLIASLISSDAVTDNNTEQCGLNSILSLVALVCRGVIDLHNSTTGGSSSASASSLALVLKINWLVLFSVDTFRSHNS